MSNPKGGGKSHTVPIQSQKLAAKYGKGVGRRVLVVDRSKRKDPPPKPQALTAVGVCTGCDYLVPSKRVAMRTSLNCPRCLALGGLYMFPEDMLPWTPQMRWQGKNALQRFQCGACGILARYKYLGCGCPEFEDRHYMNRCRVCCVSNNKRKPTTETVNDDVKVEDFTFLGTVDPDTGTLVPPPAAVGANFDQLLQRHARYTMGVDAVWTPDAIRVNNFRGGRR